MLQALGQVVVARQRRHQLRPGDHRQHDRLGGGHGVLGPGADRQHQLGLGRCRRRRVVDDRQRQRAGRARHLRGGDEIGAEPGLRHHHEQGIAHVRRPPVGGHDRRRGVGDEQAEPRLEQVAQIDADMTRAAAPAEDDHPRLRLLDPRDDLLQRIGSRQETRGGRGDLRDLARHRAGGGLSHRGLRHPVGGCAPSPRSCGERVGVRVSPRPRSSRRDPLIPAFSP